MANDKPQKKRSESPHTPAKGSKKKNSPQPSKTSSTNYCRKDTSRSRPVEKKQRSYKAQSKGPSGSPLK